VAKLAKVYCKSHKDKPLELYCFDCNTAICMMCFVTTHKLHNCSDINEVADEFRDQMTGDIKQMVEAITRCRDMIREEKRKENEFCSEVNAIEREICDRVEKLKQVIDIEQAKLLNELRSLRGDRIKQINRVVGEIEQHVSSVESLVEYTEQIRNQGTASHATQQTSTLHDRATELVTLQVLKESINDLGSINVAFTAAAWPAEFDGSAVGRISANITGRLSDSKQFRIGLGMSNECVWTRK